MKETKIKTQYIFVAGQLPRVVLHKRWKVKGRPTSALWSNVKKYLIVLTLLFVIFGSAAIGLRKTTPEVEQPKQSPPDERIIQLETFMSKHRFNEPNYAKDYIKAADKYQLDYAILPAIAEIESGGCRQYIKNNCWGWNSAHTGFGSIPEGIDFVTNQLANNHYYKGKTLEKKIKTYNSVNSAYYPTFLKLVNEIHASK